MKHAVAPFLPPPDPDAPRGSALWQPGALEAIVTEASLTPTTTFDLSWAYSSATSNDWLAPCWRRAALPSSSDPRGRTRRRWRSSRLWRPTGQRTAATSSRMSGTSCSRRRSTSEGLRHLTTSLDGFIAGHDDVADRISQVDAAHRFRGHQGGGSEIDAATGKRRAGEGDHRHQPLHDSRQWRAGACTSSRVHAGSPSACDLSEKVAFVRGLRHAADTGANSAELGPAPSPG